jgi:hypothetical protein
MSAPVEPGRPSDSALETAAQPAETPREGGVRFTPGTLVAGRYRIISPLGQGGMGEVYRADDIRLGQPVALKFLPPAFASDTSRLERLVAEVRIGRQVSHPNVCRLYDIAEADGHRFLVMEYVDGEDLSSLLRRIGRLPADKALEIARHLCAGLAAAHDKGVIHRDLKPANVMIDGRGHARIADFGLAALADRRTAGDISGTPAYMAPEQLAGQGASQRSDVFALGLVLYEMFTGRRAFEATSVEDLRALHAESKPPGLSSSARDVDPAVERAVLRCLARDPAERPASAHQVLASLPGGDPLQAALLAGETPSPEMVAAAAKVGDLRAAVAWACLLSGLIGLVLLPTLAGRVLLFRLVPLPKPPEALVERARDILARLGYREPPADSAYGFNVDFAFLDHLERTDASPRRLDRLRTARPGPLRFYYRQSPRKLVSASWIALPPWEGPPQLGRVTRTDPPLDVPGMSDVVLDPLGRLTSFAAVPPRYDADSGPWSDPDWSALLAEAGFEPSRLHPSTPRWAAPVDSDRKAAWDGENADQPGGSMHFEAAAYHGRPVYFEVQGPWVRPPSASLGDTRAFVIAQFVAIFLAVPMVATAAVLVRRNLRMGRGDRRGAFRLAALTFASLTLAQGLRADHTSAAVEEYTLIVQILSQGFYGAVVTWFVYMALEPAVRRRWPHALISWNRLLEGRFGDPLVGRDVLVGILAGQALTLIPLLARAPARWLGHPPVILGTSVLTTLNAPRHMAYFFLLGPCLGMIYSVNWLFLYYLFHAFLRRPWAARLLLFLVFLVPVLAEAGPLDRGAAALFCLIIVAVLIRFGALASTVLFSTFLVLTRAPLTLDWSAWYAGRSLVVLLFFASLVAAAFYTSLGGKPPFGRALLED